MVAGGRSGQGGNDHRKACFEFAHPGGVPDQNATCDRSGTPARVQNPFYAAARRSPSPENPWRPPATFWQPFGLTAPICLLLPALCLPASLARAATNDLTTAIQRGLFEEEANQNLGAAIQAYQSVASQFDKDRKLAATAIFRLGECYRKQGNTNDAATQYERILRDFSDQPTLVTLSRQNLVGMGSTLATNNLAAGSNPVAPTSSEAEEVKRIQAMIKDSPDLINAKDANGGSTPLHKAAYQGQLIVAEFLLANGADVGGKNRSGQTPLHVAAASGHKSMVELLLNHQAGVEAVDYNGNTPLHLAAEHGYRSVVETLLAHAAAVNARNMSGSTPLLLASANGFKSVAELLLAHGADINATTANTGQTAFSGTALCIAAMRGDQPLVELLLAKGAQVDAKDKDGCTPLLLATKGNYSGIVELLLAKGADVNAEDAQGRTPLTYAAEAHSEAITQLLLAAHADPNAGQRDPPLAVAAAAGDMPTLKLLLANGADPNTNNAIAWPLFNAVANKHADAVAELLRFKANLNRLDGNRNPLTWNPLSDAPTLKALLDGGADPNARAREGTPLLLQAVSDRNQPAVELLLAHHAEANCTSEAASQDGTTPLLRAVAVGNKPIVELLLKAGADVNARYNDKAGAFSGGTPLYEAVRQGMPDLAALLLANKADPNAKCINGWTPLQLAVSEGKRELVELLLANKADPNVRNNAGQTPLDLAERQAQQSHDHGGGGTPAKHAASSNPHCNRRQRPSRRLKQESKSETMADLLRRHGAVDDLPQPDRIEVRRPSANFSAAIFTKSTNDWNQFSLLELIAVQYHFLAGSPGGGAVPAYQISNITQPLPFPDFARLRLRRASRDPKVWREQTIDIRGALETTNCAADVRLEGGDVVEIREADHPLGKAWPGFPAVEFGALEKCLPRQVQLVINDHATNITLAPSTAFLRTAGPFPSPHQAPVNNAAFWIKPVIQNSGLLLASSDLSRVKVTRRDPATGQERHWIVDCAEASPAPDLWLRDGDKIEVPEKTDAPAAAAAPGPQSSPK